MSDLPLPMTPADSDLRDFPHTPLFRARLFGSSFHARATDSEWRAGVTLWLKSWDQVPAGSLPEDDIELCRLAELGRDAKAWKKLKGGALRGWTLCSDGRLYHPVVAEGVNTAIDAKLKQRLKTAKARIAALEKHLALATMSEDKARITEEIKKLQQSLSHGLSQTVSQPPIEGEEKEKEKEKGLDSSEAKASGGEPPTDRELMFSNGVPLLTAAGVAEKNVRSMLAGLAKAHGEAAVVQVLNDCAASCPVDPVSWIQAALRTTTKARPTYAQQAADIARTTVPAKPGKDPTLLRLEADARNAAPAPQSVGDLLAKLKTTGATQ